MWPRLLHRLRKWHNLQDAKRRRPVPQLPPLLHARQCQTDLFLIKVLSVVKYGYKLPRRAVLPDYSQKPFLSVPSISIKSTRSNLFVFNGKL